MKTLTCWKCNAAMTRMKDTFQGFKIDAWRCPKCSEVVYDEEAIQPILKYHKLKNSHKLTSTLGVLGNSTIVRIPKAIEQIYHLKPGRKVEIEIEPGMIKLVV